MNGPSRYAIHVSPVSYSKSKKAAWCQKLDCAMVCLSTDAKGSTDAKTLVCRLHSLIALSAYADSKKNHLHRISTAWDLQPGWTITQLPELRRKQDELPSRNALDLAKTNASKELLEGTDIRYIVVVLILALLSIGLQIPCCAKLQCSLH